MTGVLVVAIEPGHNVPGCCAGAWQLVIWQYLVWVAAEIVAMALFFAFFEIVILERFQRSFPELLQQVGP
ncbi:MAG: hypothetical protein MZV63_48030 [Marinilabiliales bacterium]|nr:hypothetical protein [Marinilabiliales bacterium]